MKVFVKYMFSRKINSSKVINTLNINTKNEIQDEQNKSEIKNKLDNKSSSLIINNSKNINVNSKKETNYAEINTLNSNHNVSLLSLSNDPLEYRTLYIDSLPKKWSEDEIKERFEKIGQVKNIHLVKNSLGEFLGNAIVTLSNMKSVEISIEKMKWKIPDSDPINIRFHRFETYPRNDFFDQKVLLIKNLPQDLLKSELEEFLNKTQSIPILHISYARTFDDKFKRQAYVYFYNKEDCFRCLNKINGRYVDNHKLEAVIPYKYLDPSDIRYQIENKMKLDVNKTVFLDYVHKEFLKYNLLNITLNNSLSLGKSISKIQKINENRMEMLDYNNDLLLNKLIYFERTFFNEKEKLDYYNLKVLKNEKFLIDNLLESKLIDSIKYIREESKNIRKLIINKSCSGNLKSNLESLNNYKLVKDSFRNVLNDDSLIFNDNIVKELLSDINLNTNEKEEIQRLKLNTPIVESLPRFTSDNKGILKEKENNNLI